MERPSIEDLMKRLASEASDAPRPSIEEQERRLKETAFPFKSKRPAFTVGDFVTQRADVMRVCRYTAPAPGEPACVVEVYPERKWYYAADKTGTPTHPADMIIGVLGSRGEINMFEVCSNFFELYRGAE